MKSSHNSTTNPSSHSCEANSSSLCQNTLRFFIQKKIISLFIVIGLFIPYRYFAEVPYETDNSPSFFGKIPVPVNVHDTPPPLSEIYEDEMNRIDPLSARRPEYKFRVKLDGLKKRYQVSDIIRVVIEPRHPSLIKKLGSTFFRVQITGPVKFAPQLVPSSNSSVLVYEAPLIDPGIYKMQARIMFYDFPNIYALEIHDKRPRSNHAKLERVIVNGEFTFQVEGSPEWDRLKPQLPETCSNQSILRGRWISDLSKFMPYNCIIPNYEKNLDGLPFRYTWIRFMGDSNMRKLFWFVKRKSRLSCTVAVDGQNRNKRTQYICTKPNKGSQVLEGKGPRPRGVVLTYEWYYPGSRYGLTTLLNNTFKETCKLHNQCMREGPCDLVNPEDPASESICSARRADYTFVSFGSHTAGWNDEHHDEYFKGIFQYVRESYREKLTFITTNAVNYNRIPNTFRDQYIVRNNLRVAKVNELLKSHVDKSQEKGYKNVDLLDFFGTTYPIWEFSGDAVHFTDPVYEQQARLISDKLANYIKEE